MSVAPATPATLIETERLYLRQLHDADAPFIHALLNSPAFLLHIGDRGARELEGARAYIRNGPQASYAQHGFGLWLVARRADDQAIGICGLLKRKTLADVDIGFAYLPEFCGQGYGFEAARATLTWAHGARGIERVLAIVSPANLPSIALLGKLGFEFEGAQVLEAGKDPVEVYAIALS